MHRTLKFLLYVGVFLLGITVSYRVYFLISSDASLIYSRINSLLQQHTFSRGKNAASLFDASCWVSLNRNF